VAGAVSGDEIILSVSVDLDRTAVKNTQSRTVRNRTSSRNRPETPDRRVQRTKASLHKALIGLAREKPYPSIAVKEILDRANVGRSTFYTHFSDKDDLLESGIHEVLQSIESQPRGGSTLERVVAFSLPLLKHIDEHRHAAGPRMKREGRAIMHKHMQDVLTSLIADDLGLTLPGKSKMEMPTGLIARHVASTFVLVLDWWVDNDVALNPAQVDARFRALVIPILTTFHQDG
jgi:AcrR family transcriptional regulator